MPLPRPRITVRRLMATVAVVAAFLAPLRADQDAKPNPAPGLTLVAASVIGMALVRTHAVISARRDRDTLAFGQLAWIFLAAMIGAVIIAGIPIAIFLSFNFPLAFSHPRSLHSEPRISIAGYIFGTLLVLPLATLLRWLIWTPPASRKPSRSDVSYWHLEPYPTSTEKV